MQLAHMKRLKLFSLSILSVLILAVCVVPLPSLAVSASPFTIVPFKCQSASGCSFCDITLIFTNAANIITTVMSGIALFMFILGGLFFIFSNGVDERVTTGKKILTGTVTGLAVVFFAWFIVNFVVRVLYYSNATSTNKIPSTINYAAGAGTAQIFNADWWAPPQCDPTVICDGATVGSSCGNSGDCGSAGQLGCSCYRATVSKDNKVCGAPSALQRSSVETAKTNTKNLCYCTSLCYQLNYNSQYNKLEHANGAKWDCIDKDVAEKMPGGAMNRTITCPTPNQVCAIQFSVQQ